MRILSLLFAAALSVQGAELTGSVRVATNPVARAIIISAPVTDGQRRRTLRWKSATEFCNRMFRSQCVARRWCCAIAIRLCTSYACSSEYDQCSHDDSDTGDAICGLPEGVCVGRISGHNAIARDGRQRRGDGGISRCASASVGSVEDENGRFALSGVPAGSYKLYAWHETLGTLTRDVKVPATVELEFTSTAPKRAD